jgi:hypothetical protein
MLPLGSLSVRTIHQIDPLRDPRWPDFLRRHPSASVFHTRGWLAALQQTYGYQPVALTMNDPGSDLDNGLVYCLVRSWITGRRLVSLPFSDHCEPLVNSSVDLQTLLAGLQERAAAEGCKYVEVRPNSTSVRSSEFWHPTEDFYLHRLDLRNGVDGLYSRFHKNCIQRKIRRADAEGVEIRSETGPDAVRSFYPMLVHTRRRQGRPPQPRAWFESVMRCLGESACIRCAYKQGRPIAGILTLHFGKSLYYKYGASEARFHKSGAMPRLFWQAIQDAIHSGLEELDLGRSECDDFGLVTFKERLGAVRFPLLYYRFPTKTTTSIGHGEWFGRFAKMTFSHMPDRCLVTCGSLAYRHVG